MKKAVIILPTYNEEGNIKNLLNAIFTVTADIENWMIEVLVVDSHSKDATGAIVKDLQKKYKQLHLLETPKEGLGMAYIKGFQYAIDKLHAFVLFEMDADLSHDPKKIPEFLHAIEKGSDFVIGARYRKGGSIPSNWALHRKILSVMANLIIKFGFMKTKITDWTSGYRAIKAYIVKDTLPFITQYSGYVFQVAILDNAIKQHAKISEVPIHFVDRTDGVSKINAGQYITETLWYVFTHSSFIKFVIVGGLGFIIDFGVTHLLHDISHWPIWIATLISTESAIIFNFFMNNFWSFSHKGIDHKGPGILFSLLKFNFVSSGSILIQTISIHFLTTWFNPSLWAVYKVLVIFFIIIPYSYILYNKFIWKDKK